MQIQFVFNMKKLFLLLSLIALNVVCFSQNFKENRKKADKIKENAEYYWGESDNCKNSRKADEEALASLLENIGSDKLLQPIYFQNSDDEDEQHERLLGTYAEILKRRADDIVLSDENGAAKSFRYIKKTDFKDICNAREMSILDYINVGMEAEEQYRCGDALRYYYWALMLCHSHPNGSALIFENAPTYKWLLRHIEGLLSEIVFQPRRQEKAGDNEFVLGVKLYGNSVDGLEFEYNNGNGTATGSVVNGISRIKLVHPDMHSITAVINLENKDILKFYDADVYAIVKALDEQIDFPGARKMIELDKAKKIKNVEEVKAYADAVLEADFKESEKFFNETSSSPQQEMLKAMNAIEKALVPNKKDSKDVLEKLKPYFTDEGLEMLEKLVGYGKSSIIGKPEYRFIEFNDEVLCRSIPMQFDFRNNVSFIREMVFRFDKKSNKVKAIAFRLTDITESSIINKDKWSNEARLTLINFLEDYQTAYALQRKKYLQQIFSESALIIVGTVLKETKKDDNIRLDEKVRIKYDTLSKSQYLTRLNKVFANNEFVNIRFTQTSFNTVNGITNVIGVQLKQEYFSSSYGDVGYLFLMVDLRGTLPVIHVRTWQPNETPVDEVIDAQSFVFD